MSLLFTASRICQRAQRATATRRLWSSFTANDSSLTITALGVSFPYVWLRDACQSSDCIHPSTSQKLHRSSDIPLDIKPKPDGVRLEEDGIHIEWTTGHKSFFTAAFLKRHSTPAQVAAFHHDFTAKNWNAKSISTAKDLFVPYESLQTPSGLLAAITQLAEYGLLFVSSVPTTETAADTCEVRALAETFGEIRNTFYGETWDVKSIQNSRNIAYTNLHLGLHMDLMYFQHPPRYQVLHSLRNRVEGGESIFVDALSVATKLRKSNPAEFNVLATTPVAFHYINDGHHLQHSHNTIQLSPSAATIEHINYSPPFQAPLSLLTPAKFYPALAIFAEALDHPDNTFRYMLHEGDAVVFDNRRVLHARTAFEDLPGSEDGSTNRWLKGCYFEADTMLDRGRVLRGLGL